MVTSMFDIQEQYNDFIKVFIKWDTWKQIKHKIL
jgi:hypothetical protein